MFDGVVRKHAYRMLRTFMILKKPARNTAHLPKSDFVSNPRPLAGRPAFLQELAIGSDSCPMLKVLPHTSGIRLKRNRVIKHQNAVGPGFDLYGGVSEPARALNFGHIHYCLH